jgi:hypothetical protein
MRAASALVAASAALFLSVADASAQDAKNPELLSCTVIKTAAQLQAINSTPAKKAASYCLGNDIDLSSIPNWTPIGDASAVPGSAFRGQFYGNGHVIKNLTISATSDGYYGLFGVVLGGVIEDVGITNVKINVTPTTATYIGALAGFIQALTSSIYISNTYSTGVIACTTGVCAAGGLIGFAGNNLLIRDAWSSADVTATTFAGGFAAGFDTGPSYYLRIYATGNVRGLPGSLEVGGLAAEFSSNTNSPSYMNQAYATGRVTGGTNALVGGLIGKLINTAAIQGAYATGPVTGGASATAGGLIGEQSDGTIQQVFSTGLVSSGFIQGGLVGSITGSPSATDAYWDRITCGQCLSALGTGKSTTQLRANLPSGFTLGWGITKSASYPYLSEPNTFTSTLATLVSSNVVFAFLPLQQTDKTQYSGNPVHTSAASLATVYTMIGRAIGVADNVTALHNVKINKYYWHDATQTTTFSGPITTHATLGPLKSIPAATALDTTNVIGAMNLHRLVILRGHYKKGASSVTHYMLGTLFTKQGSKILSIVANDPYTGTQVEISPSTKKVTTPGFPQPTFIVDGYQQVTSLH